MSCEQCGASTGRDRTRCRDCAADGTPLGLKLVAVLVAVGGIVTVVGALGLFASADPVFMVAAIVVGGLGLGQLAVAYGLATAKYWAWGWGVAIYALTAIAYGLRFGLDGGLGRLAGFLVAAALGGYIYQKHDRFEENREPRRPTA